MTQDDRRKLFWYLKRTSSYTAWKARADAFDRFAQVVERQVQEEPVVLEIGVDPEWATEWEGAYAQILKGQVLYEQGLTRLRHGDRNVWRQNDRGVLLDASNIHGYWWNALVNHGPQGDVFFEGKYVPEMTVAVQDPSLKATVGVVQSVLAEPRAVHLWTPEFMARLDREIPFPQPLPDIPTHDKELTVHTGDPVPCFGIFEPLIEDGCMNYLLEGAPAPTAVNRGAVIRPAAWRLIWEDTRYLDGVIPEEERLYFRPTEAPAPAPLTQIDPDPIISLETKRPASKSGVWVVTDRLNVRQRFKIGDTLPQHEGRDVVWLWVGKE
jgi:hypothetical protein